MKLSPTDRTIFSFVQYHPEESLTKVAQALHMQQHTVRRAIDRGLDSGVLRRRVYVNYHCLGLDEYSIFFAVTAKSKAQKERMRKALLAAPHVGLVLEVGGRFDFLVTLSVASPFEVELFFDSIARQNETAITDIHLQVRTGWYFYGAKYLDRVATPPTIDIVPRGEPVRLTQEDVATLQSYAESRDGNRSQVARSLGLPLSTVQYRIEAMQRSGVIAGVRHQIVAEETGYEAFRVLITTKIPLTSHRTAMLEWARHHPLVLTFMHGFGNWQYELRVEASNTKDATAVVDDLMERFADFIDHAELVPVAKVHLMNLLPDLPALLTR